MNKIKYIFFATLALVVSALPTLAQARMPRVITSSP